MAPCSPTTELFILTHSQSTPLPDEDQQCSGRNVAINDAIVKIVRQTNSAIFSDKIKEALLTVEIL